MKKINDANFSDFFFSASEELDGNLVCLIPFASVEKQHEKFAPRKQKLRQQQSRDLDAHILWTQTMT
jgi:peptidase E